MEARTAHHAETEANRSRTDLSGASERKVLRNDAARLKARHTPTRVEGANGSFPVSSHEPKRPPIGVLYEELAGELRPKPRYGQFPRGLIVKLLPWLQADRSAIVHVCSGCLGPGEGIRIDIDPEAQPDIIADGRALPFADGTVAALLIDPPYSPHYARELYGCEYPRPAHLLREAVRVVKPGGRIAFVHYITPKPPPEPRSCALSA